MDQHRTSKESRLWDHIASSVSNGWAVTNRELGTESVVSKLTKYPVRIYTVHVGTAWMAAGSTTVEMMIKAREIALQQRAQGTLDAVLNQVSIQVEDCSKLNIDGSDDRCTTAIAQAAIALASTRTYELASQRSLIGHWLLLVYPSQTDVLMHRPVFFGSTVGGLLPPGEILHMVKLLVEQDLMPGTAVHTGLNAAGGPVLSDLFKATSSEAP